MQKDLGWYARAIAGAAFVVVWMTLGIVGALLAAVAAIAAAEAPRLGTRINARHAKPRARRRPAAREELPLVPDDPSLVVNLADLQAGAPT